MTDMFNFFSEKNFMQPKKSLGQNFLRDEGVVEKIISDISAREGEVIVEVGPGEGVLTERLAERGARVVAIELDDRLIPVLEERFRHYPNVSIVHQDVLQVNMKEVFKSCELQGSSYRIVGNLPYYITSAIVRKFLESECAPSEMFFMVQKEVGERICAGVGKMSVLSVAVQYYADPEMLFVVPKESFDPIPKVESAFIRIVTNNKGQFTGDGEETRKFFRMVKIGFSARRKTLENNLANGLHLEKILVSELLEDAGVSTKARAQDLSIEGWKKLVMCLERSQ